MRFLEELEVLLNKKANTREGRSASHLKVMCGVLQCTEDKPGIQIRQIQGYGIKTF